jgi:glycosyltransferase involved in cell wall biosynthesis
MLPDQKLKILFLPAWYPNKYDQMAGLFVQQHARAIQAFADVAVLQIVQYAGATRHQIEERNEDGIFVYRIYLKSVKAPFIGKIINGLNYRWSTKYAYEQLKQKWGKPDMCHVHILTRAGWLALNLWQKCKIPYVISEHWSRYFEQNSNSYEGTARKKYTEKIVKHAKAVMPVSEILKEAMLKDGLHNKNYHIVPNVVNMERFTLKPTQCPSTVVHFLNVSCFDEKSKNLHGLIDAFELLIQSGTGATLKLAGNGPDKQAIEAYVAKKKLIDKITFTGELTGKALVEEYHLADALVMSSKYETFAIVLVEAMACGLPVIATNTGIAPEIVDEKTGKLVYEFTPQNFMEAMNQIAKTITQYDGLTIRNKVVNRFNETSIGQSLKAIYTNVLSS